MKNQKNLKMNSTQWPNGSIEFEVVGDLVGKGRPKFSTVNGFPQAYTPAKTKKYEKTIKDAYLKISGYKSLKSLKITVYAYAEPPKSKTKKFKESAFSHLFDPTTKPDIDNILKCVLDALNDVAYQDDKQVTEIVARKLYGHVSRVVVRIDEIGECAPSR